MRQQDEGAHDSTIDTRSIAQATAEFGNKNRKAASKGQKHIALWAFDANGNPTKCLDCGKKYTQKHRGISH